MAKKAQNTEQIFWNVPQAAEALGLGKRALWRAIQTGELEAFRPRLPRLKDDRPDGEVVHAYGAWLIEDTKLREFANRLKKAS